MLKVQKNLVTKYKSTLWREKIYILLALLEDKSDQIDCLLALSNYFKIRAFLEFCKNPSQIMNLVFIGCEPSLLYPYTADRRGTIGLYNPRPSRDFTRPEGNIDAMYNCTLYNPKHP